MNSSFKVSSTHIERKKMKVYQLADQYNESEEVEEVISKNNHNWNPEDKNVFLSEYNDSGIGRIPFIMKLKTDIDYDADTLIKIYNETIGYEPSEMEFKMLSNKYFVGDFYRPKLNRSYVIEEENLKKLNIDVYKRNKNKMRSYSSSS
jgi:hypothetical protein